MQTLYLVTVKLYGRVYTRDYFFTEREAKNWGETWPHECFKVSMHKYRREARPRSSDSSRKAGEP